jgi:glycosyltransferase involved in cell wall biosynthesis
MNIHFVYAGDPNNDLEKSPYSITRNLYKHLKTKFDNVYYYDWSSNQDVVNYDQNDIVLAHPNYERDTIGWKLFNMDFKVKASIHPLHHKMPEFNRPFHEIVDKVDVIFSIMGPYWYDTIDSSEFSHWKKKIMRLDISVNCDYYKFRNKKFKDKNRRTFVYVGNNRVEKGLDILYEIFSKSSHSLDMYGNIDHRINRLPNVRYYGYVDVNNEFCDMLVKNHDFFINTSISDANPTTCTEAASLGIPVVCTKGSGYWPDEPFYNIELDNYETVMNILQNMDEKDLGDRAIKQRKWVENKCNWDIFCNKISSKLIGLYNG